MNHVIVSESIDIFEIVIHVDYAAHLTVYATSMRPYFSAEHHPLTAAEKALRL